MTLQHQAKQDAAPGASGAYSGQARRAPRSYPDGGLERAAGKRYDLMARAGSPAVENVDLNAARGAITGIIGRSGAGRKSTLIRMVNGLRRQLPGSKARRWRRYGALSEEGLRGLRRQVGMIFQHFNPLVLAHRLR